MNTKEITKGIEKIVGEYNKMEGVCYTGSPTDEEAATYNNMCKEFQATLSGDDIELLPEVRSNQIKTAIYTGIAQISMGTLGGYAIGAQVSEDTALLGALGGGFLATMYLVKELPLVHDFLELTRQLEAKYQAQKD